MAKLIFLSMIAACLCSCILQAAASDFRNGGRPTDIQVAVGKVTQAVFPDKVSKVIKGGAPDSVLVEVLDNSVYLLPKTDVPSDIFVTTLSGNSYPLNLHVGTAHDIKVHVGSLQDKQVKASNAGYSDTMDLMKDLMLQREPVGASLLPSGTEVFLNNQHIKLTVVKAYELMDWKAYVLMAQNLMSNAVIVPVEHIILPDLLAISCDQDMLAAKGQGGDVTKIYMIVGKQNEFTAN